MRTQEVVMPLDNDDDSTTVFSNHAQYHDDWMHDVLEPILDGTKVGGRPRDIRDASAAAREKPDCFLREANGVFDRVRTHLHSCFHLLPLFGIISRRLQLESMDDFRLLRGR